jgi:hypothetical protein
MKKISLIPLVLLAGASAYGQQVLFQNTSSTLVTTFNGTAGIAGYNQGYQVELFEQPDNGGPAPKAIDFSDILGNWVGASTTSIIPANSPQFGVFDAGVVSLPGVTAGGNAWLEVVGWSGNQPTLAAALSQPSPPELIGFSTVWANSTGGSGSPPSPPTSITSAGEFTGLVLQPLTPGVPDATSTLALSGISAVALLFFRPRK